MVVRLDGASGLDDGSGGPATLVGQSAAKAHATFENSGTVSISGLNVSSMDDTGTGDANINFTSAFAAADYSLSGVAGETTGGGQRLWGVRGSGSADGYLAASFGVCTLNTSGTLTDVDVAGFSAMGDLA